MATTNRSGETFSEALTRIHREASPVLGEIALALARGGYRQSAVRSWAERAERAADDLRALSSRLEKK